VVFAGRAIGAAATDPVVLASSYAGGALAAAVAETVLDLVADEDFLARVRQLGEVTRERLTAGLTGNPRVTEIRGEALMIGVELDSPATAGQVVIEAARRGLLVSFCLSRPAVVRIYPPAVVDAADLAAAIDSFVAAVDAVPSR